MNLRHWLPALCGMACLGCGVGLSGIYGLFGEPLAQTFGVGVAAINTGPVALLLVPAFVAPLVGRLVDRVSIRRLMLAGVSGPYSAMLSMIGGLGLFLREVYLAVRAHTHWEP